MLQGSEAMKVIKAQTAGFCFGVKRAVDQVYDLAAKEKEPVYTYGPIIHNEEVVRDLEEKGVRVLNGKENSDVIILLHGGGLSWWNYKEVAERLQTDYHVVLPILDGHAGCDKQFTTIENNALDIIEFVNSKLGGSVLMMGGLSLGGQILLQILSQRKDICKYAIVESVLVIPSKFTYSMIKPAFGSCYGLIKYKWFSKLQFKSLRIKSNLFDEYYKDTCAIRKSDMIAFLQKNSVYSLKDGIGECEATVQIYVGEKEKQSMKKSAKIIHEKLQDSFIQVLPNMYHGEFSINHADDYVRKLLEIVKRR